MKFAIITGDVALVIVFPEQLLNDVTSKTPLPLASRVPALASMTVPLLIEMLVPALVLCSAC
jgi:hypothetical protein